MSKSCKNRKELLLQGNCLDHMKKIKDGTIDLTVTSPPYDNLRSYHGNINKWGEQVWKNVLQELYRVTKQGGVVVWVVGDATINGSETGTSFRQALWAMECGFNLHDTMFFKKINYPPLNHNRYEQCVEYMFVLSKQTPKTVNLIQELCINAGKPTKGTIHNPNSDYLEQKHGYGKPCKPVKARSNLWQYIVGGEKFNKGGKHPAVFPEKLAHDHIISWSNEGDTVLDPFMGSGTTGVACKKLNRKFIGIELDKTYFNLAKSRIKRTVFQPKLPFGKDKRT